MPGAHVGQLNYVVIKRQFETLRDGDRLWYERVLPPQERQMVDASTLAEVIRRNTQIEDEIADDVFHVSPRPRPEGNSPRGTGAEGEHDGGDPPPPPGGRPRDPALRRASD